MSEPTCTNTPVSSETGFLKRRWRSMRFFFARRAFESKLERILRAAFGHEGNALPAGDHEYELLSNEANSVCTEFADRWGLDADMLKGADSRPGQTGGTRSSSTDEELYPARMLRHDRHTPGVSPPPVVL